MKTNIIILVLAVFSHLAKAQGYLVLDSLTGTSGGIKINADIQPWNVQTGDIQAESLTINTDLNVVGNTNVNIVNASVVNTSTLVSTNITAESDLQITTKRDNTSTLIIGGSGGAVEGVVNQSATPIKIIPNHTNGKGCTAVDLYSRRKINYNSGGENAQVKQALCVPSFHKVTPYVWDTLGYFEVSELPEINATFRIGSTNVGEGFVQTVQSELVLLWVHSGSNTEHVLNNTQIAAVSTDTNRVSAISVDIKENLTGFSYPRVYLRVKALSDLNTSTNYIFISHIDNLCSNNFYPL